MISSWCISCIFEVVGALLWCEGFEDLTDCGRDGLNGAGRTFAQQMLKLGKDLLDWVQVRRVFGQQEKLGAGCSNELAHGFALVAAEIVHDDDIAGLQGGDEDLLDINSEGLAIDRTVENPWGVNATVAQGSQKGRRLPAAVRDFGSEPHAAGRPSPQWCHVRLGPGLIDEGQTLRLDPALILFPLRSLVRDVGAIALAGDESFF
jgi:hypothetical protein